MLFLLPLALARHPFIFIIFVKLFSKLFLVYLHKEIFPCSFVFLFCTFLEFFPSPFHLSLCCGNQVASSDLALHGSPRGGSLDKSRLVAFLVIPGIVEWEF